MGLRGVEGVLCVFGSSLLRASVDDGLLVVVCCELLVEFVGGWGGSSLLRASGGWLVCHRLLWAYYSLSAFVGDVWAGLNSRPVVGHFTFYPR